MINEEENWVLLLEQYIDLPKEDEYDTDEAQSNTKALKKNNSPRHKDRAKEE